MSQAAKRPRREVVEKPQVESPAGSSTANARRWKEDEMEELLDCIMKYGHKNVEKAHERIPSRSVEAIKVFLRSAYDRGCKRSEEHPNLDRWIELCNSKFKNESAWKDSLQIARVIKYLSVDGLLECHPLPERCQGVNFLEAYRLLYQALMGYPIQPVSEATSNFFQECMNEVRNELKIDSVAIEKMNEFLKGKHVNNKPIEEESLYTSLEKGVKKPVKMYQRKKQKPSSGTQENSPTVKIVVEANENKDSESDYTQSFSLTVQGGSKETLPTVINVPVPVPSKSYTQNKEVEDELLKSFSYNPFEFPKNWLEPVYLSVLQKH